MRKNRTKIAICALLLASAFIAFASLKLVRQRDSGSELSLPNLEHPVVLAEGMFFGDMGSVGLRIAGSGGNEITLFYSQPYNSSRFAEKDRLYIGIPPNNRLVARNGDTERSLLCLIEDGLGELVNSPVELV